MSDLELTDAPIPTQNGAETRRKALFLFARNDGFALCGVDREAISTVLDHHMEGEQFWEAYVDDVFHRMEREALLRGEEWDWRAGV